MLREKGPLAFWVQGSGCFLGFRTSVLREKGIYRASDAYDLGLRFSGAWVEHGLSVQSR